MPDLKVEQAFELSDAVAERSAAAATIELNIEPVAEYLRSNVTLLRAMIADGYQDAQTLARRIEKWRHGWPISIDSARHQRAIRGSFRNRFGQDRGAASGVPEQSGRRAAAGAVAATSSGSVYWLLHDQHRPFRAAARILEGRTELPVRLWICPPTRMDEKQLRAEGVYQVFEGIRGCRRELPGCSLCMGNQARWMQGDMCFDFDAQFRGAHGRRHTGLPGERGGRGGDGAAGRIPTAAEYKEIIAEKISPAADEIYRYLNFDRLPPTAKKRPRIARIDTNPEFILFHHGDTKATEKKKIVSVVSVSPCA